MPTQIKEYAHHYRAMLICENEKELEAVGASVKATVPNGHPDYKPLQEAYKARRTALREAAAQAAAAKAKEEAEKVGAAHEV